MLVDERRQYLLERLKQDGRLVAKEISQELNVSEDTIRRDLRDLAQDGLLQRVHGGALPASPALADFSIRQTISTEGKTAIGRYAAQMIQPGQVVILDGGTTCVQITRHLSLDLNATIVTHSAQIAVELVDHPTVEVILIGGRLYKHSIVSVGAAALGSIRMIHADQYFMGVAGVHSEAGLTTGNYEEAAIKLALSQQAADTFVLASSEKLGAASPYVVADLDTVSGLIVDASAPADVLAPLEQVGVPILIAE